MVYDIPATNNLMFVVEPGGFSHGLENIEDTHAFAFAKVISFVVGIIRAIVENS